MNITEPVNVITENVNGMCRIGKKDGFYLLNATGYSYSANIRGLIIGSDKAYYSHLYKWNSACGNNETATLLCTWCNNLKTPT